ncbi:hypothetical protein T492DRAFT_1124294 [Pavlovales sp. CCMP2436]|nr:hypothetical protein T492DRAFT_1124294 [Pavlovales sp. CCMP2436]
MFFQMAATQLAFSRILTGIVLMVHVKLNGAVYTIVVDPFLASYGIDDPVTAIYMLAQSAMLKEVGNLELDQPFLAHESLNAGIQLALDEASKPWGIHVHRYEIADITVDAGTHAAMERQSNPERRGLPLEDDQQSEGDMQSAFNLAKGDAEGIRLRAQAEAEAVAVLAKADAERTRLHAAATTDGLREIAGALASIGGYEAVRQRLAERYLGELAAMAKHSKMIIVPDQPNDVAAVLATALGVGAHAPLGKPSVEP